MLGGAETFFWLHGIGKLPEHLPCYSVGGQWIYWRYGIAGCGKTVLWYGLYKVEGSAVG
jgi:hypothetical protein